MIVLIANNNGAEAKRLRDAYPDRIGHIYSPDGWRGNPWPHYALDNGAFAGFNEPAFYKLLFNAEKAAHAPRWVAVPDVVGDRDATLALWKRWHNKVDRFGWPLAFVVQDGMTRADVPKDAAVIFVGGSTEFKQSTAARWCAEFPRVHIGRFNGERDLLRYHAMGAESCDGTGWFRGRRKQLDGLWYYLADTSGQTSDHHHGPMQSRLALRER